MEKRSLPGAQMTVRSAGVASAGTLTGYAAVFDKLSMKLFGAYRERIAPGAFKASLSDDIRALWNHSTGLILGRTTAGTLRLSEDSIGLRVEIDLPSSAAGFKESVQRGDVTGMSFGFSVLEDEWDEDDNGETIRTLKKVKLYEVSPCTFPAYPDTSVNAAERSAKKDDRSQGAVGATVAKRETLQERHSRDWAMFPVAWMDVRLREASGGRSAYQEQRRGAAYHEAAHAVLAVAFGGVLDSATIVPGVDERGAYLGKVFGVRHLGPEESAIMLLSGAIAYRKAGALYNQRVGDDWDLEGVRSNMARMDGKKTQAALEAELRTKAAKWVEAVWPSIQRVAHQLSFRSVLSMAEIVELCGDLSEP